MIPVCEPYLNGNEREYVEDCLKTNWISSKGKYIEEFEEKFANYCDCKYGITTTSGTTALHLALATLNIGKGDEVIVPTFTMAASAFAVTYCGAKPIFVDCEPETYNINTDRIEEKITERTEAIMPVHIYGHPCDMEPILKLAMEYDLYVIEDAAEALGAEYRGRKVGGLSHISCFSFYANKMITTGEGGMVVTDNEEFADKAKSLKDLCHSDTRFLHTEVGFNYRMTNLQAAIGLAQLEKIDEYVARRRDHALLYNKLLGDVKGVRLPIEKKWAKNVYWMYAIQVEGSRDEFMKKLRVRSIETRTFFIPMHQQPMYEDGDFPVADEISKKGLYLPSGSGLTTEQIERVCSCVKEVL